MSQKPTPRTSAPTTIVAALPEAMTGRASPAKAAVGDKPVFAYIASLPQPQRGIAEAVDALAATTLPGLERSVKWGMAYYGVGDGWCFSCGAFAGHVKLMFINGVALEPVPPVTPIGMGKATRGVELVSLADLDEAQVAAWMRQVTSVPGLGGKRHPSGKVATQTLYEAAGGEEGLVRLAEAWHARVMADDVVSHAFSHGFHPAHTLRLAAYWGEALGGPTTYSDSYGDETSLERIHAGNGLHEEMDLRGIACFDQAMGDVGIGHDDPLWAALHAYFAWATNTTMARFPDSPDDVPNALRIPRWSWEGLVVGPDPT